MAGEEPSAADAAIYPFLATLQSAATKADTRAREIGPHPLREVYLSIGHWMALVETVP